MLVFQAGLKVPPAWSDRRSIPASDWTSVPSCEVSSNQYWLPS
jgi:hypothetical protein